METFRHLGRQLKLDFIPEGARSIFFTALSFEERSLGWIEAMSSNAAVVPDCVVINYGDKNLGDSYLQKALSSNRKLISDFCSHRFNNFEFVDVLPYSTGSFERTIVSAIEESGATVVLFDITGLTKIHAISLARIAARWHASADWYISYTRPENYGNLDDTHRWSDVLIAPLVTGATLGNEENSRGIIVTGFEAHRVKVALGEVEPSGGILLNGQMHGRPDQAAIAKSRHRLLLKRLISGAQPNWQFKQLDIFNFDGVFSAVDAEIDLAQSANAPVFVYPFGPKPLVFATCFRVARRASQTGWFVYTVPGLYDADYSEGISATDWMHIR